MMPMIGMVNGVTEMGGDGRAGNKNVSARITMILVRIAKTATL
jgi:hypothetical protein